jgi:hypothetical protein
MNQPALLSGNVVEPSHISQPHSFAAHDFFGTIRDVIHKVPGYHTEAERESALATVAAYEKHVTGPDAAYVVSETDRAPSEDVSLRRPPGGLPATAAPGAVIDYAKLAAAIVAAQAAAAQQQQVSTITDVPPRPAGD